MWNWAVITSYDWHIPSLNGLSDYQADRLLSLQSRPIGTHQVPTNSMRTAEAEFFNAPGPMRYSYAIGLLPDCVRHAPLGNTECKT